MIKPDPKTTCLCGVCRKCKNRLATQLYRKRLKQRRFYNPEFEEPLVFRVGSSLDLEAEFDIFLE